MNLKKNIFAAIVIGVIVSLFAMPIFINVALPIWQGHLGIIFVALLIIMPLGAVAAFLIALALRKWWSTSTQVVKFLEVGTMNTVMDFGVVNGLLYLTGHSSVGFLALFNTISFSTAVINSYFWNKYWTFSETAHAKSGMGQFISFVAVTLVGLAINDSIILAFKIAGAPQGITIDQWINIAKVIATSASLVWNFFGYKIAVFAPKKELASSAFPHE